MAKHDKSQQSNIPVRKAQPMNDNIGGGNVGSQGGADIPPVHTPSGPKAGNFIVRGKDALSSAAGKVGSAVKNGVRGVSNSWFGLKPLGGAISGTVGKVADFLHVSKPAVSIGLSAVLLFGGGAAAVGMINGNQTDVLIKQEGYYDSCLDDYQSAMSKTAVPATSVDVNAQMLENGKKLWALGKKLGMTDEQCAGMLGALQREASFDPTCVETYYDSPYQWAGDKTLLFNESDYWGVPTPAMDDFVPGAMKSKYDRSGISINLPAYMDEAKQHYCAGIGVVAWTGPTAFRLIDYSRGLITEGKKTSEGNTPFWWEFEVQCANMITNDTNRLNSFLEYTKGRDNVYEATAAWFGWMERGLGRPAYDGSFEQRYEFAREWYAKFSPDSNAIANEYGDLADTVIDMAGTVVSVAGGQHAVRMKEECTDAQSKGDAPDNSSLAAAIVAYAWETGEQAHNNGTQLYQEIHQVMLPGDGYYRSCDRSVACAVWWSGADDSFAYAGCSSQLAYLKCHPDLWEPLGALNNVASELQPGDILIVDDGGSSSHILMYTGNEIVREKYPSCAAVIVQGSLCNQNNDDPGSRSPACGSSSVDWFLDGGGDGRHYVVFRYLGDYSGTKKDLYTGSAPGDA